MVASLQDETEECGRPWYLWPNLLGLDAPAVAVLWCWFYADVQSTGLPWYVPAVLGGAVWCIYVSDRLLDVGYLRSERAVFTPRHRIAARYRWWFVALLVLAGAACAGGAGAPGG